MQPRLSSDIGSGIAVALKKRSHSFGLVPKLQLPEFAKLELRVQHSQAGAWERVNYILSELGWIKKGLKGWGVTDQGIKLGSVQGEDSSSGIPYARWPEGILNAKALLDSIDNMKGVDKPKADNDKTSCSLDINLKLFDLLGRLGTDGIWAYWGACGSSDEEIKQRSLQESQMYASSIKALISNNPVLFLPEKEDQAIDIFVAVSLLALDADNHDDIRMWLAEIISRAGFAYKVHGHYPCILNSYSELLLRPKGNKEYRENATSGSILYPIIALWAALLDDTDTYSKVALLKQEELQHCNFQYWYPDDSSEEHFYTDSNHHGAVLSNVCVDRSKEEFLKQVFGECDQSPHFKELSAIKFGWWPLIVVACRHYRLPLPLQLIEGIRKNSSLG